MVNRMHGRIDLKRLDRVSPLAAPMLLEVGKVPVSGSAEERLLAQAADNLLLAAGLNQPLNLDTT